MDWGDAFARAVGYTNSDAIREEIKTDPEAWSRRLKSAATELFARYGGDLSRATPKDGLRVCFEALTAGGYDVSPFDLRDLQAWAAAVGTSLEALRMNVREEAGRAGS
ncbi:hypothetical protein [Methylobacterium soli]|uniref:Uncharacterized protein n=1 Tax=Methylobacterium soli TaxID=553447 RepID=A0A6L3STT0_9HYPH|nr:hypothetical protein [Methylobacterium soli]KAB1072524.1 hypothetical protein F6X53_27960 [Methylobacterium soli]GJE43839.1 hypothetical protein AEGHOMDF_3018 [Methylobacterium soli]